MRLLISNCRFLGCCVSAKCSQARGSPALEGGVPGCRGASCSPTSGAGVSERERAAGGLGTAGAHAPTTANAAPPPPAQTCQMRTENRAARAPGMAREALRMPGTHRPPCRLPPRPAAGAPEPRAERGCRSRAGRAALRRDVPAGTRNASDDRSPFTVAVPRPGPSPQGPGAGLGPRHSPVPARLPGPEARERPRQRGAAPLPPRPRRGSTRRPDRGQARDGAGRVSQSAASSWR